MKRILTIDGGGALALGPLRVLAEIERNTGAAIHRKFHGFAGTSTGAVIAAGLAAGFTVRHILNVYEENIQEIFEKKFRWPWQSKYAAEPLQQALEEQFGRMQFGHLGRLLFIPYSDFAERRPRVFDNYDKCRTLHEACLISCSAPTYFPPVDGRYADGGLLVNNPAMVGGVGIAKKLQVPLSEVEVVSIGTGGRVRHSPLSLKKDMGVMRWAKPLITFLLEGGEDHVHFQCENIGFGAYHRLEPTVTQAFQMDDLESLDEFCSIWSDYYSENQNKFLSIFSA